MAVILFWASSRRKSLVNPVTQTIYPVNQEKKPIALRKHAAVLFQHHGQLPPRDSSCQSVLKRTAAAQNTEITGAGQPDVQHLSR